MEKLLIVVLKTIALGALVSGILLHTPVAGPQHMSFALMLLGLLWLVSAVAVAKLATLIPRHPEGKRLWVIVGSMLAAMVIVTMCLNALMHHGLGTTLSYTVDAFGLLLLWAAIMFLEPGILTTVAEKTGSTYPAPATPAEPTTMGSTRV